MAGGYGSRSSVVVTQSSASSRILFVLTALPLSLALFAFVLQWRGGGLLVDPARIGQLAGDNSRLPGVQPLDSLSTPTGGRAVTNLDCANQLFRGGLSGFPYHPGWQYAILNDVTPKAKITDKP